MPSRHDADQRLLVDLINTLHRPDGADVLVGERAVGWLADHGGGGAAGRPARLDALRDLREGLRQLALANDGRAVDPSALARAGRALAATPLVLDLGDAQQPPALAAGHADPASRVLAAAAGAYLALRAVGGWARVKCCADPECQYAFVDTTRNASRRWCAMAGCGNRAKQRSWRGRQAHDEAVGPLLQRVGVTGSALTTAVHDGHRHQAEPGDERQRRPDGE